MQLSDGTVIHSNLQLGGVPGVSQVHKNNLALRSGVVTAMYYPDEDKNESKTFIEYDVVTTQFEPYSGANMVTYRRCKIADFFGMSNNYMRYTLQAATKNESNVYSYGSQVLILCIDGSSHSGGAMIVGGIQHSDGPTYVKDDGQFYDFQFNGLNMKVDKDGAFSIEFNSPIDKDGNKANGDAAGTSIKISKDGVLTLSDNQSQSISLDRVNKTATWTNGSESIVIDKEASTLMLTSNGKTSIEANGGLDLTSGKDASLSANTTLDMSSKLNMTLDAKVNLKQTAGVNWELKAGANVKITSGGLTSIESAAVTTIKAPIVNIGAGAPLPAATMTGMVIGVGNLGLPTIGYIVTGSPDVFIG